ncbi:DUF819 domain-containing protein [Sphingomonas sp. LaA6.9]|uniref:DUF819 family protein n=1 Tax=Sphingomonas sp. LaA6.9 TaxID=2919914 RepID=UPI001F4F3AC4|nr:DUF819 family protein [Sphingomonas sp. LaA6.9]MCJ8158706.1 DUF819 family protein [Sphingomonas sp. LaA6.9]
MIAPDNFAALLAIVFGLAWLGFWSERNRIARKLPGVVWILAGAALLSNLRVIPHNSPLYDFIGGYVMPIAIPLLLYKATFAKILGESGRVLPLFFIGAVGVCAGAIIGCQLLDLGQFGPHIAATYAAAWIGGMTDMVAMAEITNLPADTFAVAVSASAPVSVIGLMILVSLPNMAFVRRRIPSPIIDAQSGDTQATDDGVVAQLNLAHMAGALALSAAICWAGNWLAATAGHHNYGLFVITLITVLIANVFPGPMRALKGDFELGMFAMYLFFAVIGAGTDVTAFLTSAPVYFVFGLIIILVHIAIVLLATRLLKSDLAEGIIGSGANIVGAAAAAGIATSKEWKSLVTPAIATGMLGKAIANFFGVAVFRLLS